HIFVSKLRQHFFKPSQPFPFPPIKKQMGRKGTHYARPNFIQGREYLQTDLFGKHILYAIMMRAMVVV
ncbi:MAG: hypothetical protein SFW66_09630, partial [Gammaproteobacteria bacterium]|nr:hypothetical protein [Gammaproteobacteria bacterium]